MSFDTGTCRMAFDDNDVVSYIHSAATSAWTPVYITGQGVMIPTASFDANVIGSYRKRGILNFIVASGATVTKGDKVYYDSTNGVIQSTVPTAGFLLGTAMDTGTGTSTGSGAVNVDINTFGTEGLINVYGSGGAFKASYASPDLAIAALVANDILILGAGSFTLSAGVNITKGGVKIFGSGKTLTTVVAAVGADYAFKTVLGALAGSTEVYFGNMTIDHGDDATQVGIQVDNVLATKKLVVNIENIDFESDGGNSIDVDHTDDTAAVRVRVSGDCYIEGPVNYVTKHAEDQMWLKYGSVAVAGIVASADNVDSELVLVNSGVKNAGITGGHSNQRLIAINAWSETDANPNVYAGFVTGDGAGSHTEVIWPAS